MLPSIRQMFVGMIVAAWTQAQAQDQVASKVDEFVRGEMLSQHIPGLSLVVNKDGQIALVKGYGLANVELQVPVKPETVFQSGSVGKQFTATAVMMLIEEGKIGLDDRGLTHRAATAHEF